MFDKEKFKDLIEKALGNRSTTEYANDSGVNRTYISKYLNKRLDNAPSPEIIKKLSDKAYNNVTYEDFMEASGYIKRDENTNNLKITEKAKDDFHKNNIDSHTEKLANDFIKKLKEKKILDDEEKVKRVLKIIDAMFDE